MSGFLLFVIFTAAALYWRAPAWGVFLAAALGLLVNSAGFMAYLLLAIIAVICCYKPARRFVNDKIFAIFKKITPTMSETEQVALDAGTVWWDGELFSGKPDFNKLQNYQISTLTEEEQAFLDGPTEELCAILNDWEVNHQHKDLPPEAWKLIKNKGFLGMIIKKQYGGLEFSNFAHAKVVTKLASRCGTAAVTVMVPNSLGPGELLQHYGTEEQKNYYLPRLAKGLEIPCFALTSPHAGSDAGAIPDFGIVCKGSYTDPRTGERHEDVLGIRVSWEKRWITLAPVATVLGLAFKMYDPDGLLGDKKDIGITCALIPAEFEGVNVGRRHYPSGSVFMNGPTWGKDVFIPLDYIIGGVEYAGKGWQMLMECLAVGRCISLPANGVAAGKVSSYTTALYARIRDQFGLPIGYFEGVDEAMARIAANTYQAEAAQDLALSALDQGEKPSVIAAILKYHNTERMRKTLNDAMDVHGGRTVVLGPRNYLAQPLQTIPIGITVEGANILTRSMMIFGQGAIRCHPYVLREMRAAMNNDAEEFNQAFGGHVHFIFRNMASSLWLSLSNGFFITDAPAINAKYYRQISRLSANFAFLADMCMFTLGGKLKFKEKISARLGDILSNLYIASAVLKRFENQGCPEADKAVMQYAVEQALYDAQTAMDGVIKNMPSCTMRIFLQCLVLPTGRNIKAPSDKLGTEVAQEMMKGDEMLQRLAQYTYISPDENDPIGVLAVAHQAVIKAEPLEKKLRHASRQGEFAAVSPATQLQEALEKGILNQEEFDLVTRARKLKRDVIMVDDFDMKLDKHDEKLLQRHVL